MYTGNCNSEGIPITHAAAIQACCVTSRHAESHPVQAHLDVCVSPAIRDTSAYDAGY